MRLLWGLLVSLIFFSFSACTEQVDAEKLAELYNELDMYDLGKRDSIFPHKIEQIKKEASSESLQVLLECFQHCIEISNSYRAPEVVEEKNAKFLKILTSPAYKTYPFIIQYVIYNLFTHYTLTTKPKEEFLVNNFYCLKMLKEADEDHGFFLARAYQTMAHESVYYGLPFGFYEDNVQLALKALGDKKEKYAVLASDLYFKIATLYMFQNKYEEALPNLNMAIELIDTLNNEHRDMVYFPEKIYLFGKMKLFEQMENEKNLLFNRIKETNYPKKLKKIIQTKTAYFYCLGGNYSPADEILLNIDAGKIIDCSYAQGPDGEILFLYHLLQRCIYKSENRPAELKHSFVSAIDFTERCLKYDEKNLDLSAYLKDFISILETVKNEEWLYYSNKSLSLELQKIKRNNYYITRTPLLSYYEMDESILKKNNLWQSFPWYWILLNASVFLFLIWCFVQLLRINHSASQQKKDMLLYTSQIEQLVVNESQLFRKKQSLEHLIGSFQRITLKHFKNNVNLEAFSESAPYKNIYSKLKNNYDRLRSYGKHA